MTREGCILQQVNSQSVAVTLFGCASLVAAGAFAHYLLVYIPARDQQDRGIRLQRECSDRSRKAEHRLLAVFKETAGAASRGLGAHHYNPKLGKCFVEVDVYLTPNDIAPMEYLIDANEDSVALSCSSIFDKDGVFLRKRCTRDGLEVTQAEAEKAWRALMLE